MGLFDFLKPTKQEETPAPKPAVTVEKNLEPGAFIAPVFQDSVPPNKKLEDYINATTVGWAYACASVIAEAVAKTRFRLFQTTKDGPVEIEDHPLLELIYRVNDFTTFYDHIYRTQMFLEGAGEAPWYLERSGKKPVRILLLRPDRLSIIFDKDKIIGGYNYRVASGKEVKIAPEDIIFLRNPSPDSDLRGIGTVRAASITLDTEEFAEKYNRNFFFNGARPDFVLETDQPLRDVVVARLRKMWESLFQGVDNAHKMAVLDNGLKLKTLGLSQKDMDFFNQIKWSSDKILAIFRVPKAILGITEDVNLANAQVAEMTFMKFTVLPKIERLVQQLNEFLVPNFGDDLYLDFDNPVPENKKEKSEFYKAAIDTGWMTVNEVRVLEGLPGLKGGDVVLKPQGLVPQYSIDPTLQQKKTGQKEMISKARHITKEMKQKKLEEMILPIVKSQLRSKTQKQPQHGGKRKPKPKPKKKEQKPVLATNEARWGFQENINVKGVQKFENQMKERMTQVFSNQKDRVLKNLDEQDVVKQQGKLEALLNAIWDKDATELQALINTAMGPVIVAAIKEQAVAVQEFLNLSVGDVTGDPRVAKEIEDIELNLSGQVSQKTRNDIKQVLAEGIEAGEGAVSLRQKIAEVFDKAGSIRAEMIARTESIRASNFAAEKVYQASGVKVKEWITAQDERTCQWCAPMDGRQIKIGVDYFKEGDTFIGQDGGELPLNYSDVSGPPLHPNCRCTLGPVIEI